MLITHHRRGSICTIAFYLIWVKLNIKTMGYKDSLKADPRPF